MIADKSNAEIVPVRIEGLEQTPFSRLSKAQVRRRWFPKVKVTILEPVKLTVDPELKGRKRRLAAGAALYGIMSDLVFRTTSTDRTVVEAVIASRGHARPQSRRHRGSRDRRAHLQAAAGRRRHPRHQAHAAGGRGARGRRHAAQCQRRGRHHPRPDVGGPRAGHDQFHRRRGQHPRRLQGRADRHHRHLAHVHREGQARPTWSRRSRTRSRSSISRTSAPSVTARRQDSRPAQRQQAAGRRASPTTGRRSCSRRAPRACRRASCSPTATCWRTPRRPPPASISAARTRCSTCCRCSIRSG